ncbi:MAG: glycosyltransferase family 2 protein [Halobacteriota archaeon]
MADAEPLITVIIPTFRRPMLLRRAILSVLNQTFPAFQVCVYDNASGDDTEKVVAELAKTDSRIKYWCHEQNIGGAANFNYGLKEVNTSFFTILCDDDLVLPHFFEQAIDALVSNPDVMFYEGLTIVTEDNEVVNVVREHERVGYFPPHEGVLEMLTTGMLPAIVFRSKVRDSIGILDVRAGWILDTDFELRIAGHHPIILSNEPSAIFTQHKGSITTSSSDLRLIWPGYQIVSDKIMSDESLPLEIRIVIRDAIEQWLFSALCTVGERARDRGESDTVCAVAELMKRVYNKNARSKAFLALSKLSELSKPAYSLVNLIKRLFVSALSFRTIRFRRRRLKLYQKRYGKYLQYLDKYVR